MTKTSSQLSAAIAALVCLGLGIGVAPAQQPAIAEVYAGPNVFLEANLAIWLKSLVTKRSRADALDWIDSPSGPRSHRRRTGSLEWTQQVRADLVGGDDGAALARLQKVIDRASRHYGIDFEENDLSVIILR